MPAECTEGCSGIQFPDSKRFVKARGDEFCTVWRIDRRVSGISVANKCFRLDGPKRGHHHNEDQEHGPREGGRWKGEVPPEPSSLRSDSTDFSVGN